MAHHKRKMYKRVNWFLFFFFYFYYFFFLFYFSFQGGNLTDGFPLAEATIKKKVYVAKYKMGFSLDEAVIGTIKR